MGRAEQALTGRPNAGVIGALSDLHMEECEHIMRGQDWDVRTHP